MTTYTCEDCGHTGEPEDVDAASIVDGVQVTCADCGVTTVQDIAFASALLEEHRADEVAK